MYTLIRQLALIFLSTTSRNELTRNIIQLQLRTSLFRFACQHDNTIITFNNRRIPVFEVTVANVVARRKPARTARENENDKERPRRAY